MTTTARQARLGRRAMTAMFLANGFIIGSWAPQIPLVMTRLEISETLLGILILLFGIGALIAMPSCGYLMGRYGSRAVLRAFALLACFGLLFIVLAPSFWLVAPAMVFFGGAVGGMDVAMNTNAVAVEQHLGRGIMSSSHGFWSLGGFFGGGLGGIAIQSVGFFAHACVVTVVVLAIVLAASRFLVVDPHHSASGAKKATKFAWPTNPLIYMIGLIALFSMIPEGAVLDWAALYLQQELGADIATAGFAFAAFSGTMAAMRFLGDHVRGRFGAVRTMRASTLIAASGIMIAGVATEPHVAIAAFAFAGLGVANIVPIAFSAAGNQKGTATATSMSVVTTMGYSGILVAPSIVGFVGERTGLGPVFVALAVFLMIVCLKADLVRSADFTRA
jgi:predicted MFS family arabinose efflux permease